MSESKPGVSRAFFTTRRRFCPVLRTPSRFRRRGDSVSLRRNKISRSGQLFLTRVYLFLMRACGKPVAANWPSYQSDKTGFHCAVPCILFKIKWLWKNTCSSPIDFENRSYGYRIIETRISTVFSTGLPSFWLLMLGQKQWLRLTRSHCHKSNPF